MSDPAPESAGLPKGVSSAELGRVQTRQVRLSVSIPALMFLITLLVSLLLHANVRSVANAMPAGDAKERLLELATIVLYGGIAGSLAAAGVGVLLAWQIVRPLQALRDTIRVVAEGQLANYASVASLAEIGSIGSAFNDMVDQLNSIFETRNRQMRDAAPGTVVSLDKEHRVIATDAGFRRVAGFRAENVFGTPLEKAFRRFCQEDDAKELCDALRQALAEADRGLTSEATVHYRTPHGEAPVPVSVRVTPLEHASPDQPAVLVDLRDMSAVTGFHEQIQRADRLAAVGTLAAGISHEIRNPLASMRAMVQLMIEDTQVEGVTPNQDYLQRIIREIDRLDRLVSGIKLFASKGDAPVVQTDLNRLLREVYEVALHRVPEAKGGKVRVRWELDENLPRLPLEEDRIHQAFLNLVLNAIEALCERGGGELSISTRFVSQNLQRPVVIYICNDGDAIPREERDRLFEPFYTTKAGGTGLGLPIAYQIVTSNNGTIELVCENSQWEFWVRFPAHGTNARLTDDASHILPIVRDRIRRGGDYETPVPNQH